MYFAQKIAGARILSINFQQLYQLLFRLDPLPFGDTELHGVQIFGDPFAFETLLHMGEIEGKIGRGLIALVGILCQHPLHNVV